MRRVRRESVGGAVPREHDEREAERLAGLALVAAGLPLEGSRLGQIKAGDPRKALVACLRRERTMAGNRWIAQGLRLGHAAGVARLAGRVPRDAKLKKAYRKLAQMLQCAD